MRFTLTNNGDTPIRLAPSAFTLQTTSNVDYRATTLSGGCTSDVQIAVGEALRCNVTFETNSSTPRSPRSLTFTDGRGRTAISEWDSRCSFGFEYKTNST
ncbi:MAG: hypothetical protein AB7R00_11320 [Kofleriaceae bacterium]